MLLPQRSRRSQGTALVQSFATFATFAVQTNSSLNVPAAPEKRMMRVVAAAFASVMLAACGGGRAVTPPVPVRGAGMASASAFDAGLRVAERHRVAELAQRRFTHAELWRALAPALASPALRTEEIGQSLEGRELRAVTFGGGATRVLLWSQMHGDESTATMALADVLRWMADASDDPLRERLRRELTVVMVPMLNPDGAEVFER